MSINTEKPIPRVEISTEDTENRVPRVETKPEEKNQAHEIRKKYNRIKGIAESRKSVKEQQTNKRM